MNKKVLFKFEDKKIRINSLKLGEALPEPFRVFSEEEWVPFRIFEKEFKIKNLRTTRDSTKFYLWVKTEKVSSWKNRRRKNDPKYYVFKGKSFRHHFIENGWIWTRINANWDPSLKKVRYRDRSLEFQVPQHKTCIRLKTDEGSAWKYRFKIIPKRPKWNIEDFFQNIGLYLAEGHKSYHEDSHLAFTNSDLRLLKEFLNFLEELIPRDRISWNIRYNEEKPDIDKMASFLSLNKDLLTSVKEDNTISNPIIRVYYSSKILKLFFRELELLALRLSKARSEFAFNLLKGWWAGDGCRGTRGKSEYLSHLKIRSKDHLSLLKQLFKKCDIKFGTTGNIIFTKGGAETLLELISDGFCSLKDEEIAKKGLKKHSRISYIEKTLELVKKHHTRQEIWKILGKDPRWRLYSLLDKNLLKSRE